MLFISFLSVVFETCVPDRLSTSKHSDALSQDNSDAQYRSFRLGLPALAALMATFFALKYAYTRPIFRGSSPPTNNLHRVPFYLIFSLLMLIILHGASVLKVLIILSANYVLAWATGGRRFAVPVTWIFNCVVLLANEWYEGYSFASLHSGFAFLVCCAHYHALSPTYILLQDSWGGVYPRWHVSFNITMLRLVSFSVDYHWACNHIGIADVRICPLFTFLRVHGTDAG